MDILFVSGCCSDELYEYILNSRNVKHVDPSQKFFKNIIYGLQRSGLVGSVTVISVPPISKSTHSTKKWEEIKKIQDEIPFISIGFTNGRISRITSQYKSTKKAVNEWLINTDGKERCILCDPLIMHTSVSVLNVAKNKCPIVAIVTDLPLQWMKMNKVKKSIVTRCGYYIYNFVSHNNLCKYDGYIWLTKQMNDECNKDGKPYLIIEGVADVDLVLDEEIQLKIELPNRFAMYAGGINKIFHIDRLCQAFINADIKNCSLLLFGDGNDVDRIIEYSRQDKRIRYMGVVPSSVVRVIEERSILLINPRPSCDEYTKYSFPSKTLEYMGTGTPVLSTKLSGIPLDYSDFMYWFDDESEAGMTKTIDDILNKEDTELKKKGLEAKCFVKEKKSAIVQGTRIINWIKSSF